MLARARTTTDRTPAISSSEAVGASEPTQQHGPRAAPAAIFVPTRPSDSCRSSALSRPRSFLDLAAAAVRAELEKGGSGRGNRLDVGDVEQSEGKPPRAEALLRVIEIG